MNKNLRDNILREAKGLEGTSIRQIARVFGLGRGIAECAKNDKRISRVQFA
jgi:hypothetical protein